MRERPLRLQDAGNLRATASAARACLAGVGDFADAAGACACTAADLSVAYAKTVTDDHLRPRLTDSVSGLMKINIKNRWDGSLRRHLIDTAKKMALRSGLEGGVLGSVGVDDQFHLAGRRDDDRLVLGRGLAGLLHVDDVHAARDARERAAS
jgi:hypothetical protein